MQAPTQPLIALSTLMHLEGTARAAQSLKELQFLIVNETRRLIAYRQAFLFKASRNPDAPYRVETASSVSAIDRNAPLIRWLERAVHGIRPKKPPDSPTAISEEDCPGELKAEWQEFSTSHTLWCPLQLPDRTQIGGIWLNRETAWEENELILIKRLSETYAHAWNALVGMRKLKPQGRFWRVVRWTALAVGIAVMFLPVRLSTLAPATVVAKEPAIVSAPMDGVIADILVPPNTPVTEGQSLLTYEDTNLRNRYEVSEKNLAVALAEYHQASQGAFQDPESKAKVPLLKAEVELRRAERDYAKELLDQVVVKAPRTGILLYTEESDWIGRPVVVGERVMDIADPRLLEIRIDLPVKDSIVLHDDARVKVFLDARPLEILNGTLTHASYHAEELPGDVLAYRVTAQLDEAQQEIRIGWQGTAKIYGEKANVFFLVFRRPIAAARQFLGL